MSILRSEWCLQQWSILLVTHPDVDSGMDQAAQQKRRQALMRNRTYTWERTIRAHPAQRMIC